MLRLSNSIRCAIAAAALLASSASVAQGGGLDGRITAAGTKLDQDVQKCGPINLGEYVSLLQEAAQNKRRAEKAAKAGVPINQAQVDADLANASALFNRAQAALVQQCMRAAQGQAQPQAQPQAALTPTPATAPGQAAVGQGSGGTDSAIGAAEAKLDADIKACRPIRVGDYDALAEEAHKNAMVGLKASAAGVPVDANKLRSDMDRADQLLKRARDAEAQQKACPPKREATTEPPPTTTGALIPNSPPLSRFAQEVLAVHNQTRQAMNVAPLRWNPVLEEHATARAGELARIGQLVHAPREGRGIERENILEAPVSYTPTQMMGRWASEQQHFVPGIFPNVCNTGGDCSGVWHYTQMIWSTTTDIGCGQAQGHGFNWLVCRYSPGGNKDGKPVVAQTSGFQGGAGIEGQVTEATRGQTPPVSKLDSDLRVRQDWGSQQISEWAKSGNAASNHEYGYDSSLFVGYDLGSFRIEAETAYNQTGSQYKTHSLLGGITFNFGMPPPGPPAADIRDVYELEGRDMSWMHAILFSPPPTYVDTNVEQPPLPNGEVFKPKPPEKLDDPM